MLAEGLVTGREHSAAVAERAALWCVVLAALEFGRQTSPVRELRVCIHSLPLRLQAKHTDIHTE